LDQFVERKLRLGSIPGLTVGVTSKDGLLGVRVYGFSDLGSKLPVVPDTLFQIGSISKSFSSIVAMQLQDEGKLDVQRPVGEYLPWLRMRSAHGPVTMHHLMSHTAGLPTGTEATTEAVSEVWSMRNQESGPPGAYFHYSNMGYKIVGMVIETLTGIPVGQAISERVFAPLGMRNSIPIVTQDLRERLASGYLPAYDDRPMRRGAAMAPAPWVDCDSADGSISSNAEDMTKYIRLIMNKGFGPSGRIVSEAGFKALTTPVMRTGPSENDAWYAYGLDVETRDGHSIMSHTGGMVGYISAMCMDMDVGVGAIVLSNGATSVDDIARYAVKLFRSSSAGASELPKETPYATTVEKPEEYEGQYLSDERSILVKRAGNELLATHEGVSATLDPKDKDSFFLELPGFELHLVRFRREGDEVVELTHGPSVYRRGGRTVPAEAPLSPAWASYCGHYRTHNPWLTNFRVFARKGSLWLSYPSDEEHQLFVRTEGVFSVGDPRESPEWIRFYATVGGKTQRATLSGEEYARTFTP
jgi:CubicO group peptidase (beta-lactamase class C family)